MSVSVCAPGIERQLSHLEMRKSFYIMKEKEIYAYPQPDGRGIQYLFQDGERKYILLQDRGRWHFLGAGHDPL